MWYSQVHIKNFRGIRDLRIDFAKAPHGPVTTLVGLNESGKTTILDAINHFEYGSENLESLEIRGYGISDVHDLIPISQRANFNDRISIKLGVQLDRGDIDELSKHLLAEHDLSWVKEDNFTIEEVYPFTNSKHDPKSKERLWSLQVRGTKGKQRNSRYYGSKTEEWQGAVKYLKSRLPRILYFPNFLFRFPELIALEPKNGATFTQREAFYRTIIQDILDSLDNETTVDDHILYRAKSSDPNDKTALDALLLEMGRHITRSVFGEWNKVFGREISGKAIRLQCIVDDDGKVCIRFRLEDADGLFEISERSLGFRWFFVYLLLTLYRGFRKDSVRKLLFLFDEPASNLHSGAQVQLLQSFDRLSQRCRIIYATHSHHLINPSWLETTLVVRNTGLEYDEPDASYEFNARMTDIKATRYREFAAEFPDHTSYFQPILDVLEYKPANLEFVPNVVMLEGKNDFYTLDFMRAYLDLPSLEFGLLPGGGAGSLDTVIRLYLAWGRDFVVLLDGDAEGREQRRRYGDLFGAAMNARVFGLSDVEGEWRNNALEKLFEAGDRQQIMEAVYGVGTKQTKTKFNRAIQELYLTRKRVEISSLASERFRTLLVFLRDALTSLRSQGDAS
jgi:hypothetical protein